MTEERDLSAEEKRCPQCGLPHRRNPALDEQGEVIEVEVRAHIRRYRRQSYTRHPGWGLLGIRVIFDHIEISRGLQREIGNGFGSNGGG